jgi:hypothetical protein
MLTIVTEEADEGCEWILFEGFVKVILFAFDCSLRVVRSESRKCNNKGTVTSIHWLVQISEAV